MNVDDCAAPPVHGEDHFVDLPLSDHSPHVPAAHSPVIGGGGGGGRGSRYGQ